MVATQWQFSPDYSVFKIGSKMPTLILYPEMPIAFSGKIEAVFDFLANEYQYMHILCS